MTQTKKLRIRWRRIVTMVIAAYLVYWCGVSVHHMLAIGQREAVLSQKIAMVRSQNYVLTNDIHSLHNPTQLKKILSGNAPLPNASIAP